MQPYAHIELPASIASLFVEAEERETAACTVQQARLAEIGKVFRKELDEDVKWREESGIESVWLACEEAYAGMDDSNRHEFAGSKWTKPMTSDGPISTERADRNDEEEVRSNAFERMTARYVDAAAAKVSDIMLPQNDEPFTFEPTPVPDLVAASEDGRQLVHAGVPLQRDATYAESLALSGQTPPMNELNPTMEPQAPVPMQPGQGPAMPLAMKDLSAERMKQAMKAANGAKDYILDWFVEAGYTREMRLVNHDSARIGVGVMKGPFPKVQKSMAVKKVMDKQDGSWFWQVETLTKLVPSFERKDPWNIYPAKNCGENIHSGDHLFERDLFTKSQLRTLAEDPGYLSDQIEAAILEGPNKRHEEGRNPSISEADDRFDVWFRYGIISREDMQTIEDCVPKVEGRKGLRLGDGKKDVYAILTMVNDRVVRVVLNPSHLGKVPYHANPWSRRAGHWAGVGVSEQVSLPQRGGNGALRAWIDNAGISSGVQLVVDTEAIEPVDGRWNVSRNKVWRKRASASIDDVRKAITAITIPCLQPQLEATKNMFSRMAEDSTSIPLISQGQSGATSPETLGQSQLQDNNANQLLRDKAHDFDQNIKLPIVQQTYEYLLLDPDVPDEVKGDYKIKISSSVALVEQAIHDQFIQQLFPVVQQAANPYRVNPAKLFALVAKSKRLNPLEIQYTDAEWDTISKQPPPKDKVVQVAEINAQATIQRAKMDTDRDQVYVQAETERTKAEHETKMAELQMRERLAMLDYANQHKISLEQLKTELATTTMKLQVTKELSAVAHQVDLHKHKTSQEIDLHKNRSPEAEAPIVEPSGRAENGHAFEQ